MAQFPRASKGIEDYWVSRVRKRIRSEGAPPRPDYLSAEMRRTYVARGMREPTEDEADDLVLGALSATPVRQRLLHAAWLANDIRMVKHILGWAGIFAMDSTMHIDGGGQYVNRRAMAARLLLEMIHTSLDPFHRKRRAEKKIGPRPVPKALTWKDLGMEPPPRSG